MEMKLSNKVDWHIKRKTDLVMDLCADTGQMLDNVKHMKWFRDAVAATIIESKRR